MDGTTIDRASHHAGCSANDDLNIDTSTSIDASASSGFVTPTIARIHSHDVDEFCEALLDWSCEVTQLRPGTFLGHATCIPLGPALICLASFNQPMMARWRAPDWCWNVVRPGPGSDAVTIDGRPVGDGEVAVIGPSTAFENVSRGRVVSTMLSIKLAHLERQAEWLGDIIDRPRTHQAGTAWTTAYLDAMEWIVAASLQYESALAHPAVCASLADALFVRVNLAHAAQAPLSADREIRASRRVAVERAREYIKANLSEPIRLSDLCRYARMQARSLEYGFRETLGISPIAYVRAIRLQRARRLLRSTAVRCRSISAIALDCGFWHLSQFALDYKTFFGESPSVTYRRTQTQLPRDSTRRAKIPRPLTTATVRRVRIRSSVPVATC